jgi:hypothetical protein
MSAKEALSHPWILKHKNLKFSENDAYRPLISHSSILSKKLSKAILYCILNQKAACENDRASYKDEEKNTRNLVKYEETVMKTRDLVQGAIDLDSDEDEFECFVTALKRKNKEDVENYAQEAFYAVDDSCKGYITPFYIEKIRSEFEGNTVNSQFAKVFRSCGRLTLNKMNKLLNQIV